MGSNTRIFDKFENWSLADCACEACLYYSGEGKPCLRQICCCAEEKAEALMLEIADENRLAVASVNGGRLGAVA